MPTRLFEEFDGEVLVKLPASPQDRQCRAQRRSGPTGTPRRHPRDPVVDLLGITTETDPVKIELELNPMVPAMERGEFSFRMILHGRGVVHRPAAAV